MIRTLRGLAAALAFAATGAGAALPNPILFVSQVPTLFGESDFGTITATFGSHQPSLTAAPRGGSLHVLYPDGTVRDLLADAIVAACANGRPTCDPDGAFQVVGGTLRNGYAVREPTVHWDGDKVVFSMVKNVSRQQFQVIPADTRWQLYEIAGLAKGSQPVLTKVANQPAAYNNVAPAYTSDDKIVFASDRPITGKPIHYPQIDEYESHPTVSGLWKLDPATGALLLMDHSPSGLFTPFVDSLGQVIFTRWDHLQQDQQALGAIDKALGDPAEDFQRAYTYYHEDDVGEAQRTFVEDFVRRKLALNTPATDRQAWGAGETNVPEYHLGHPVLLSPTNGGAAGTVAGTSGGRTITKFVPTNKFGRYDGIRFNIFQPWQINQDGSGHETFRHMGRHELQSFINRTYYDDPAVSELALSSESTPLNGLDGYFQLTEVPPAVAGGSGTFVGVVSPEFATHASGFLLQITDTNHAIGENGKAVAFAKLTDPASTTRYRNPIRLSDGTLVAAVDEVPTTAKAAIQPPSQRLKFRLYSMKQVGAFYVPDAPLTPSVSRTFNYWDPDQLQSWSGALWEMSPVEVRARPRPPLTAAPALPAPEAVAFADAGVDVAAFRQFLRDNDLALIVSRDVTKRDEADRQQPANLRVDPLNVPQGQVGAQTQRTGQAGAKVYDVAKLTIYQNDLVRGYGGAASGTGANFQANGLRGLARVLRDPASLSANPPTPGVPGARIAHDGSYAAFVPARRAVTWTLADRDGAPVVRERYWLTFAPGEVRVCASCHGVNQKAQDGSTGPTQTPQALRDLLAYWKAMETSVPNLVTHYYQSLLRRAPDAPGLAFWEGEATRMRAHGSSVNEALNALSSSFLTSAEYKSFNRDDAGFVTDLYAAFFDRAPDGPGLAFWTGQIQQGMPREVVYVSFLFTPEFDAYLKARIGNGAARAEVDTVVDFYRGLLGRLPDSGGFNAWLRSFREAQCDGGGPITVQVESISKAFAESGEYAARNRTNAEYVGDLYNAFLRRGGDLAGVQFWIQQLQNGTLTRSQVRQSFAASAEFGQRVGKMAAEGCLF